MLGGATYGLVGLVVRQGLMLLTSVSLANYLGADQYGIFAVVAALSLFAVTVSGLGLTRASVRFIPQHIEYNDYASLKGDLILIVGSTFFAGCVVAAFLYLLSAELVEFGVFDTRNEKSVSLLQVVVLGIPFTALSVVSAACAQGFRKIANQQAIFVVGLTMNLVVVYICWLLDLSLKDVLIGYVLNSILLAFLGIYLVVLSLIHI